MALFQDPIGKAWWWIGGNSDSAGVFTEGFISPNVYSSNDLMNWTFIRQAQEFVLPGTANNNQTFHDQIRINYNAANSNYVLWTRDGFNQNFFVYTSSSPGGPYTLQNNFTTWTLGGHTYQVGGDFFVFVDSDGASAYMMWEEHTNGHALICKMAANWLNLDFTNFTVWGGTFASGVFGQPSEAYHMVKAGSTYIFQSSSEGTVWEPGYNLYVQNTTGPLGTWSAAVNPFQPSNNPNALGLAGTQYGFTQGQVNQIAFDTQTGYLINIPGRNGWFYVGERYDNGLIPPTGVSATASFINSRLIILPLIFTSPTSYTISWTDSWTFDGTFPTVSGAPLAASNLLITGNIATWTNNEPSPANVYLDSATDVGFTQAAASEVLAPGSSSFSIALPNTFYRVRTTNANGSSISNIASRSGAIFIPTLAQYLQLLAPDDTLTIGPSTWRAQTLLVSLQGDPRLWYLCFESPSGLQLYNQGVLVTSYPTISVKTKTHR